MEQEKTNQPLTPQRTAFGDLMQRRWMRLVVETGQSFQTDNCGQMAAALAYFALLSAFPLLLLLVSQIPNLLALFSVSYDVRKNLLELVRLNVSPQVSDWLSEGLSGIEQSQGTAGLIGVITLLWSASGVFGQLDASFNYIWRVYEDAGRRSGPLAILVGFLRGRFWSFLLILVVGVIMLLNSVLTTSLLVVQRIFPTLPFSGMVGTWLGWLISLAVSTAALGMLYRYLPHTRILWSDVWLGALLAALANELAKGLVARFITGGTGGVYQSVAGPLALMIWVYFTSQILFVGCELTRRYALIYGSRASISSQ